MKMVSCLVTYLVTCKFNNKVFYQIVVKSSRGYSLTCAKSLTRINLQMELHIKHLEVFTENA